MFSRTFVPIVLVLCFFLSFTTIGAKDNEVASKVAFLPFDTRAAGKYASIEVGLQNMLVSRLAVKDRIEVIEHSFNKGEITRLKKSGTLKEKTVLFDQLGVDYIVSGGFYALEKGLQIQVTFHPAQVEKQTVKMSILAEGDDKIVEAVEQLSQKIAEKVFGYESTKVQPGQTYGPEGADGFRTDHPEKIYKKGVFLGESLEGSGKIFTSKGVRKSLKIPMSMVSMAMGDLDGDGEVEIVLAGSGELRIFQFRNGIFKKTAVLPVNKSLKMHAVNLADLNQNGKKEIIVSANDGYRISSIILEWSPSTRANIILQNIPWYIRPLEIPGEGLVLAGQNRGINRTEAVRPGIFRLEWATDGNKLERGENIPLPSDVNLFDFVLADLDGDGQIEKIVINTSEKMIVYDQGNRIKWVSSGEFGGSKNYFGPRLGDFDEQGVFNGLGDREEDERDLIFIPTKLIVKDADNDGKPDIIIGRNNLTSWRFFENLRSYEGSFISCLTWNGSAMSELWRTNTIGGYVADYDFSRPSPREDNEAGVTVIKKEQLKQVNRLFVGQLPEQGIYSFLMQADDETRLLAYEIDFQVEEPKKVAE